MRKLKLEVQVSIDGYTADATGNSSWMVWPWTDEWTWDEELRQYVIALTESSDCILLSRKMAEEGFHAHWERVVENPANPQYAFAKPITDKRKVVFTKTLKQSIWKNTELATGDLIEEINRLKREPGKDIIVYGGATFASSLIRAGLIDELHLFVNPAALGEGNALFKELGAILNLNLVTCKAFSCGVVLLLYVPKA